MKAWRASIAEMLKGGDVVRQGTNDVLTTEEGSKHGR